MRDGSTIWLVRCRWVWVCIDDFVAPLLAIADYAGDAAEDTFAFLVGTLLAVAVEDLGIGR